MKATNQDQGITLLLNERYKMDRVINQDDITVTYDGYDKKEHKRVLVIECSDSKKVLRDKISEFKEIKGTIQIVDYLEVDELNYIIMEYVEGINLAEYHAKSSGKITYQKMMDIVMPVISTLQGIREKGITYGPIHLENIVIESNGQVKIIPPIIQREVLDTYIVTEEIRNNSETTECFFVGRLMYLLLTGDDIATLSQRQEWPYIRLIDGVTERQHKLLESLLSLNFNNRIQSLEELKAELVKSLKRSKKPFMKGLIVIVGIWMVVSVFNMMLTQEVKKVSLENTSEEKLSESKAEVLEKLKMFENLDDDAIYAPQLENEEDRIQAMKLIASAFNWDLEKANDFSDVDEWASKYIKALEEYKPIVKEDISLISSGTVISRSEVELHFSEQVNMINLSEVTVEGVEHSYNVVSIKFFEDKTKVIVEVEELESKEVIRIDIKNIITEDSVVANSGIILYIRDFEN